METVAQLHPTANAAAIAREVNGFRTARSSSARRAPSRRANVSLWVIQYLLAAVFLMAGVSKFLMSAEQLTADSNLSVEFIRFIGVCETLGAVGLVLPWSLNIRSRLTPLAAAGLVVIMIGATLICAEATGPASAIVPAVVGLFAFLVASGRRQGKFTAAN